jgi:hypothetical protein
LTDFGIHGFLDPGSKLVLLIQRHPILDQQRYPRVKISHIPFKHEILLGLSGYLAF